jgi:hypothetical protein
MDHSLHRWIAYNCNSAVSQCWAFQSAFAGLASQLVRDARYHLGISPQRLLFRLHQYLMDPVVNGLFVLVVIVAAMLLRSSLFNTFQCCYNGIVRNNFTDGSFTASIGFKTSIVAVAVLQFAGMTFNPVEGFASHSSYYCITSAWNISCKR